MNQRSTELLDAMRPLDLSTAEGPIERLTLAMDWVLENSRIEALGWWEHTSDWDLTLGVELTSGRRFELTGTPSYSLTIGEKEYSPAELLANPSWVPFNYSTGSTPDAWLNVSEGMIWEGNPDGIDGEYKQEDMHFRLDQVKILWLGR